MASDCEKITVPPSTYPFIHHPEARSMEAADPGLTAELWQVFAKLSANDRGTSSALADAKAYYDALENHFSRNDSFWEAYQTLSEMFGHRSARAWVTYDDLRKIRASLFELICSLQFNSVVHISSPIGRTLLDSKILRQLHNIEWREVDITTFDQYANRPVLRVIEVKNYDFDYFNDPSRRAQLERRAINQVAAVNRLRGEILRRGNVAGVELWMMFHHPISQAFEAKLSRAGADIVIWVRAE